MPKRLNARFVETVKSNGARQEFRDLVTRGLELRVSPKGAKTWAVLYRRRSDGLKRRVTIGAHPAFKLDDARTEAKDILARAARGEDPALKVQLRREASSFKELASEWDKRYAVPNKSEQALYDDRLMLKKDILPAIGRMKVEEITKRDVICIADSILERGARVRCNRALALMRSIFRWGMAEDLAHQNPTFGVRDRTVERPRDRVLGDDEIRVLWKRLPEAEMSEGVAIILQLALVTGQRVGMISGMTKAELELDRGAPAWTLRGARTKNREAVRVPLTELAARLIRRAIALSGESDFVFPSPVGDDAITPHAATRAMSRWRKTLKIGDFRVHDLRRTCATGMARLGVPRFHVSLVLDHVSVTHGTITGAVYDKYTYDAEKRAALEIWSTHLVKLLRISLKDDPASAAA
jgi:integrase